MDKTIEKILIRIKRYKDAVRANRQLPASVIADIEDIITIDTGLTTDSVESPEV
jgi:hypothetical protein